MMLGRGHLSQGAWVLMKRILALGVALLALTPAFAQTKGKSSAAPTSNDGERVAQLDEQLAGIVDADKSNCDKMAGDVKAFSDKNGAEMQRLRDEGMKRSPEQRAEFQKKYGARIQAATAKMNAAIPACIQNPKVKAALAGLSGGGHPPTPAAPVKH